MANIDQYNNAFVEVFGVNASTLNDDFSKEIRGTRFIN